jgi:Legume lectin domain
VKKLILSVFLCFSLGWVVLTTPSVSQAQTVTSSVSTPLDLGSVKVCAATAPLPIAGCSASATVQFNVTAGGMIAPPQVLTLGAPDQDFQLSSTNCAGNLATGFSCVVNVTFAPKFPGVRSGAVLLTDDTGNVLATRLLRGQGLGPQLNFTNGKVKTLATAGGYGEALTLDAAGNIFYFDGTHNSIDELPAGGGPPEPVFFIYGGLEGLAVDGAGNLYFSYGGLVMKVPRGCPFTACGVALDGGFIFTGGIAVDPAGNVYVADLVGRRVVEFPFGCVTSSCLVTIGQEWNYPMTLALDNAGNLFVGDDQGGVAKVNIASGQKTTILAISETQIVQGMALDAAGDLYFTYSGYSIPNPNLGTRIMEVPAGGSPASAIFLATFLDQPLSLALDGGGNLFTTTGLAIYELPRVQVPAYTFVSAPVGAASSDSPQEYPLQNTGTADLSLLQVTLDPLHNFEQAEYPLEAPRPCATGFVLSPGAMCGLDIAFTPQSAGLLNVTGSVVSNSGNTTTTQNIPVAGIGGATGASLSFPIGFSTALNVKLGLTLNGNTALRNTALQLTDGGQYEAGSAFFSTPIGTAYFQTSFDFQLTGKTTTAPDADGIAFVLQNQGLNALGTPGGGLGYGLPSLSEGGTQITNSVAVKFDLYDNDGEGNSSTGFYINGAAPTVPAIDLQPSGIDLHSGDVFHVVLVYDGSNLNLSITDKTTKARFSTQFPANLPELLGGPTAYAGFTGGTGGYTATQNILNWQLTSSN